LHTFDGAGGYLPLLSNPRPDYTASAILHSNPGRLPVTTHPKHIEAEGAKKGRSNENKGDNGYRNIVEHTVPPL
jgi:hypothetical protein